MTPDSTSEPQRFWDFRAAGNFIGGGAGSGLLLFAAVGAQMGLPYFLPVLGGLACIALGLTMVWFEIGRPWRALHVFFRPQTAWMSRESIAAVFLFAIGALALGSVWHGVHLPLAFISSSVLVWLTAVVALVFLSCQLGMLYAVRGVPAWREQTVMPLVGLTGLAEGLGLYLILLALWGRVIPAMLAIALGLIFARALAWQMYVRALHRGHMPALTIAAFGRLRVAFLLIGHALPALLIVMASYWPEQAGPLVMLAGAAVTLAGWAFKFVLITRAAYTRAVSLPEIPVRGGPVTPMHSS